MRIKFAKVITTAVLCALLPTFVWSADAQKASPPKAPKEGARYRTYGQNFKDRVFVSLLLLFPTAALAEVSDKEPTLLFVWTIGAVAAVICFFGTYFRKWLAPILATLPLLWFASFLMEIHSKDVGPYLYAEQGLSYYVQSYLSLTLFISGIALGLLMNKRRKNRQ